MTHNKVLITNLFTMSGGGTRVALCIAKCLVDSGFAVDFVSLKGLNIKALERIHGIPLRDAIQRSSLKIYYYPRLTSFSHVRYFSYRSFIKLVKTFIDSNPYDAIFFFDDILNIRELPKLNTPILLYIHFSYIHRIESLLYEELIKETGYSKLEIFKEKLMRKLISNFFVSDLRSLRNVVVLANSTVTYLFTKNLFKISPIVLYPPIVSPTEFVNSRGLHEHKRNIVVSIGALEPSKRLGVILEAFAKSKIREKAKLVIVGIPSDMRYFKYLQKKVVKFGMADRVIFLINISDEDKWNLLLKSKVIVHAKVFEPFGIAVAEGMYAGCIPIVYKGPLSGPWIDLAERGKHGYGFGDVDELAELMELVFNDYRVNFEKLAPLERAKKFSFENFQKSLIRELPIRG